MSRKGAVHEQDGSESRSDASHRRSDSTAAPDQDMDVDEEGREEISGALPCYHGSGRNRKPSRRMQEAVLDYQVDPADYSFQMEITRLMSFGRAIGCNAPEQVQRKRGWKARREEEAQFLIKVRNRFPQSMGKGVPGMVHLDDHWVKCMVGGRVGPDLPMRDIVLEDGTRAKKYVHSLVREDELPDSDISSALDCVLEPYGSEAWGDVRCGRHILVSYDHVYYLGFIAWHRKNVEKAWHVCFEDGEELDIELPTIEEDGAVLMPMSWSEDVRNSANHDWWGHKYAAIIRDGDEKAEKMSVGDMIEVVERHQEKPEVPTLPLLDEPLCVGWEDWASKGVGGDYCEKRGKREESILGGKRITIDDLNDIVDKHGGYAEVTKGRLWSSLSVKLGIKTIRSAGSSLRRWYTGFHGIDGHSSEGQRSRSIKDQLSTVSQSALEDPIASHRQGLAFIFGPLFKRGVNQEQQFRMCAMGGEACAQDCDCEWISVRKSWENDEMHPDFEAGGHSRDDDDCDVGRGMGDPMASKRCCGSLFLRRKDLERHWKEQHAHGVGVCLDGYRDPRRTWSAVGNTSRGIPLCQSSPLSGVLSPNG